MAQLEVAILNLVMTNIRTAIGSLDLDESLSKRDEINAKVLHRGRRRRPHPWGLKVNRIELKDIQPPRDLVDSMARQMKAEREKRANILEAEGHRQSEILRAEGDKQAAILEAEGKREAAFREAEARERTGRRPRPRRPQLVSDAIAQGNVQAINYFVAQKYIEAFKSAGRSAEPEVRDDADGVGRRDRIARRHRRTGEGSAGPPAHARGSAATRTRRLTCSGMRKR